MNTSSILVERTNHQQGERMFYINILKHTVPVKYENGIDWKENPKFYLAKWRIIKRPN